MASALEGPLSNPTTAGGVYKNLVRHRHVKSQPAVRFPMGTDSDWQCACYLQTVLKRSIRVVSSLRSLDNAQQSFRGSLI